MSNPALDALINKFGSAKTAAAAGGPATVNPTPAAQVLATSTAAEVNGTAAPAPQNSPAGQTDAGVASVGTAPAAASAPAAPAATGDGGKPRRTAAVVQAELDVALAKIAEQEKLLSALSNGAIAVGGAPNTTEELVAVLRGRGYAVYLAAS
jgi:hypothetical protein